MVDNCGWVSVDLVDAGDPAPVSDAVTAVSEYVRCELQEGRVVVFDGGYNQYDIVSALHSVRDHVDRFLTVYSCGGGRGATISEYYDSSEEDFDEPVERVENGQGRRFVQAHFDYFAARYGIDGVF